MCAPLRRSASQPYSSSRCPSSSRDLPGEHPGDHPGDHQLLQRPRAALETESYSRDRELLQRPRAALETKSYSGDRELLQSAASGLSTRHQPQPQPATPRHRTPNLWWRLRKHLLRTCFAPASHLLRTCFAPASHLLRTCFAPASHLLRTCCGVRARCG
jgi:hypothetical protein